jgi:hypothetical protein
MHWRLAVWLACIVGWLVMLLQLWTAFATFPTPERLEQARLVAIPTLQTVALLAGRSALELAAVLALLWPLHRRAWTRRVLAAAVLLAAWFLLTTPLSLSAIGWVHRRWLAAMVTGLLVVSALAGLARLVALLRGPRTP